MGVNGEVHEGGRMRMEDRGPEGEVGEARRVEVLGIWRTPGVEGVRRED